jgi:hypothetical protein
MADEKRTIVVSWSGVKRNGKTALCTGDGDTAVWYCFGKSCPQKPEYFVKGKTYDVLVGTDKFHIKYINGLSNGVETGEGGDFDRSLLKPENTPQTAPTVPQGTPTVPKIGVVMPKNDILSYLREIRAICDNIEKGL